MTSNEDSAAAQAVVHQGYSHSVAIIFGHEPAPGVELPEIHGGSAGIVVLGGRMCAVTCQHVLDGFAQVRKARPGYRFQIGNLALDPFAYLIDCDQALDLAVIDLSGLETERLNDRTDFPLQALRPTRWPNPVPRVGDLVVACGYPAMIRELDETDKTVHSPGIAIAERVDTVDRDGFVLRMDRTKWVNVHNEPAPSWASGLRLGGMSGAPVFAMRNPVGAIGVLELVGTVLSELPGTDGFRIRSSACLATDGTIDRHRSASA